eukprot:2491895-Rhodomonas_salina.3
MLLQIQQHVGTPPLATSTPPNQRQGPTCQYKSKEFRLKMTLIWRVRTSEKAFECPSLDEPFCLNAKLCKTHCSVKLAVQTEQLLHH